MHSPIMNNSFNNSSIEQAAFGDGDNIAIKDNVVESNNKILFEPMKKTIFDHFCSWYGIAGTTESILGLWWLALRF
jgi:hypothetical protein